MFKQLYELARRLLFLARETEENTAQIKKLQQQMEGVMAALRQLAGDRSTGAAPETDSSTS